MAWPCLAKRSSLCQCQCVGWSSMMWGPASNGRLWPALVHTLAVRCGLILCSKRPMPCGPFRPVLARILQSSGLRCRAIWSSPCRGRRTGRHPTAGPPPDRPARCPPRPAAPATAGTAPATSSAGCVTAGVGFGQMAGLASAYYFYGFPKQQAMRPDTIMDSCSTDANLRQP